MKTLFTEEERGALREASDERARVINMALNGAIREAGEALLQITHPSQAPGGFPTYHKVASALEAGFKKVIERAYDDHIAKL